MASRFKSGDIAYSKNGIRYTVDEVADGLVYCTTADGDEAEYGETQVMTAAEWAERADSRTATLYTKLKQARAFAPVKGIDGAEAGRFLQKAENLFPGILDFAAFTTASRVLTEAGNADLIAQLSIIKCRALFDEAEAATRASLLAGIVKSPADKLLSASRMGDNMARAMIEKGLDADAFDAFGMRRRQ